MLTQAEIIQLLHVTGAAQDDLFAEARHLRKRHFGNSVILRGVVEVTNLCRLNCAYCPMRRDNTRHNEIFHLSPAQIAEAAAEVHKHDIGVVSLQGGEIPQTTESVAAALPAIQPLFARGDVLLVLGGKSREDYARLKDLGATSYIL